MLKTLYFRIIFAFTILTYLFVTINVLLTKPIDGNGSNITTVRLHVKTVSGTRPSRGSLNYDLYVLENNEHYKIGANYADCFYYGEFSEQVTKGDLITMQIKKNNGFMASDLRLVVSLRANNREYLSADCVNEQSNNDKVNLPVFGLVGLLIIYGLFYYQEQKNVAKKQESKKPIY